MLTNALFVFFGGAIGAMIREGFMLMIPHVRGDFPLDIFVANILAAFLLGLATKLKQLSRVSDQFVLFVGTGVMGGMSTFSSYVYGAYSEMMTTGDLWWGVLYVIASLVLGYFATLLGLHIVRGSAQQA